MKPLEILTSLQKWAKASPGELLASPAWAMPCRLGERQCTMRLDGVHPSETLDLAIRLEDEDLVLGIADTPAFPELHAIWPSRADVPEPLLLALVEKDCGAFLQLVENAVRRQLRIVRVSTAAPSPDERTLFAQIVPADGEGLISFSISPATAVEAAFGQLRYIDAGHQAVRDTPLSAETEYATFSLPAADLSALTPGAALLLPEIGTLPARFVVEDRLFVSEAGVAPWKDDGQLRICAAAPTTVALGLLLDSSDGDASGLPPQPLENAQLKLVRYGKTLARGHLARIGSQFAFSVEAMA